MKSFVSLFVAALSLVSAQLSAKDCAASYLELDQVRQTGGAFVDFTDFLSCQDMDMQEANILTGDVNSQDFASVAVKGLEVPKGCNNLGLSGSTIDYDVLYTILQDKLGMNGVEAAGILVWAAKNNATVYSNEVHCVWSTEKVFAIVSQDGTKLINFTDTTWIE